MLKKNISLILLLVILLNIVFSVFSISNVEATSNRYNYDSSTFNTSKYPGYKALLDNLKSAHPKWKITIMDTGLDWEQVITAEKSGDRSLIQGRSGNWVSGRYDEAWDYASESAIRYYMDPRNWLTDGANLIQFMQLSYVTISDQDLYNAINGTFLHTMEYAKEINKACKEQNVNPIYVVARILQEQGNPEDSGTFRMKDSDGTYYYNLFNIGATGAGASQIIANALAYAKAHGWTSISACLGEGIEFLAGYIKDKQDTLYLNKFDVETYDGTYWHQYMQNIEAPKSEGSSMYTMLQSSNQLENLTLVVPVYNNMPDGTSMSPDRIGELGPINIRVKAGHSDINVRKEANASSSVVTTLNAGDVVLSIQRFSSGWHKIVYNNSGATGFVKFDSSYLEQIGDIINCNETMTIADSGVSLMAGPNSSEMKKLVKGQIVTRIDNKGSYNVGGAIWDRIQLSNGTQGYVKRTQLLSYEDSEIYTVATETDPLALKDAPAGSNIRYLPKGTRVTRIEIASSEVSYYGTAYYWDKVVTPDGAVGYVARYYLADKTGARATGKPQVTNNYKGNAFKKDDTNKQIKMEPNTTVEDLKSLGTVKVTKADGKTAVTSGNIGTGYKITVGSTTYTAVKYGDSNGDGKISSADYVRIKNKLRNVEKLSTAEASAADANLDGKITSADYVKVKNVLRKKETIKIAS